MKYNKWEKSETWFLCIYIIHWFHRIAIQKPGFPRVPHNEWTNVFWAKAQLQTI